MKNYFLALFLIFTFTGCATTNSSSTLTLEKLVAVETDLTSKGARYQKEFEQKIQPSMSTQQVIRIASTIGDNWFKNGQPDTKKYNIQNGIRYEIYEFNFYRETVVLVFNNNKLVKMSSRNNKTMFN